MALVIAKIAALKRNTEIFAYCRFWLLKQIFVPAIAAGPLKPVSIFNNSINISGLYKFLNVLIIKTGSQFGQYVISTRWHYMPCSMEAFCDRIYFRFKVPFVSLVKDPQLPGKN